MSGTATTTGRRRLVGVDAARGVALIGMMSVHLLPATTAAGEATAAYQVASGRASALFAVLAGVSLALATGRDAPPSGAALAAARRGVAARGAVVAAVGLTLGAVDTGLAVILVHYALLFCCALAFLGLRWRALAGWAAGWLLLSPVAAHALRSVVAVDRGPQPSWLGLVTAPSDTVVQVLLTGYYPVLQWTGYLLVGLAVGRTGLRAGRDGRRAALGLLGVGATAALAAWAVSSLLLGPAGGQARLAVAVPPTSTVAALGLETSLRTSMYGTTPTTSWWWLAVAAPHSGTPPDLVHTAGAALAVLGVALLVAGVAERAGILVSGVVRVLAAMGAVPLTLYTGHALALAASHRLGGGLDPGRELVVHVVVAAVAATLWRGTGRRGPLEAVAAAAARAARGGTGVRPAG